MGLLWKPLVLYNLVKEFNRRGGDVGVPFGQTEYVDVYAQREGGAGAAAPQYTPVDAENGDHYQSAGAGGKIPF